MITIVDYGLGNIRAFANVYKRLNIDIQYASTVSDMAKASKIILPGVGAFDHAMGKLNDSGLRDCLEDLVLNKEIPVVGVCVGMQMMAHSSEEGSLSGLSWIDGTVKHFSQAGRSADYNLPLPHMGWNNIKPVCQSPLISNLDESKRFYFLHSYYFQCQNSKDVLATASYGFDYACVINHRNIYGIQCHPEKSHHNGVTVLKNFAELS